MADFKKLKELLRGSRHWKCLTLAVSEVLEHLKSVLTESRESGCHLTLC